jgi:uncharacterized protein YgbK (DUF1537 family)
VPAFPLPHDYPSVIKALQTPGRALLGVGDGEMGKSPMELSAMMAGSVVRVLQESPVARLLIEGGATAAAVLRRLGWKRLTVSGTSADVALLHPIGITGPQICLKPGSYPWPEPLWPTK